MAFSRPLGPFHCSGDGYLSFKELKQGAKSLKELLSLLGLECHLNEQHLPNLNEILQSMDSNDDGRRQILHGI